METDININTTQSIEKEKEKQTEKDIDVETKNNEIKKENIDELCKCDVCKDFLFEPVTLFCQHTFCYSCVIPLKECPMCRLKLFMPIKKNKLFSNIIDILYGPEKNIELSNKFKRERIEKELTPKILDELNHDFNKTINNGNNNLINNGLQNNLNNRRNNINQGVQNGNQLQPQPQPESQNDFLIFGINISLLLKAVEVGFLIYYIYSFIKSLRYEINWFRTGLNLIIILQSIYSIFMTPFVTDL